MSRGPRERVTAFIPLAAGWKAVYATDPGGDLESAADHDLYWVSAILCAAHIDVDWGEFRNDVDPGSWDRDVEAHLRPVTVVEERYISWSEDSDGYFLLIGPGEDDQYDLRGRAIDEIRRQREREARKRTAEAA